LQLCQHKITQFTNFPCNAAKPTQNVVFIISELNTLNIIPQVQIYITVQHKKFFKKHATDA